MKEFGEHFRVIQATILEREYSATVNNTCSCSLSPALYRCLECFFSVPSCRQCIITSHVHSPFHHIQRWTGTHFKRTSLSSLGLTLHLGHASLSCPNALPGNTGRAMTIVHTNGVHSMDINFCHCAGAEEEPTQLVASGLFPATIKYPATAFTFAVLKEFHIHTTASKKSAFDYVRALEMLTDNVFPDRPSVSQQIVCHTSLFTDANISRAGIVNLSVLQECGDILRASDVPVRLMTLTVS